MIVESGRVVAVEGDALWVETIRRSTCQGCAARSGCGHGLLNRFGGGRRNRVRVALPGDRAAGEFQVDDEIEVGLPAPVLLGGIALAYLMPLALLLGGLVAGARWGDGAALAGAAAGLLLGFALARLHARRSGGDSRRHPVVAGLSPRCRTRGGDASLSISPGSF